MNITRRKLLKALGIAPVVVAAGGLAIEEAVKLKWGVEHSDKFTDTSKGTVTYKRNAPYYVGDLVQGSDGAMYYATQTNTAYVNNGDCWKRIT